MKKLFQPYSLELAGINELSIPNASPSSFSDTWDGFLFAAPKKKTPRMRKRFRNYAKQLKPLKNIVKCNQCGNGKLLHHLCPFCHPFIRWIGGKDEGVYRFKTTDKEMDYITPRMVNKFREDAKKK